MSRRGSFQREGFLVVPGRFDAQEIRRILRLDRPRPGAT
jgi:hypothetical protein